MGTATIVVVTAASTLEWAATPSKAIVIILIHTTAGFTLGASVVIITNVFGLYWRWR